MERLEEATEMFKLMRAAYAVLSDPHERKWYDDHRDAILRGHSVGGDDDDQPEEGVDVMPYFVPAAYSGFSDKDPRVRLGGAWCLDLGDSSNNLAATGFLPRVPAAV